MTLKSVGSSPFSDPISQIPTPLHVYSHSLAIEDAKALSAGLKRALPAVELYYSTKTNSLLPLLRGLLAEGWGLEVVCPADRKAAILAGASGKKLLLNGPAWSRAHLDEALFEQEAAQLTIDSLSMADLLGDSLRSSSRNRPPLKVALRIHEGESHFGFPPLKESLVAAFSRLPNGSIGELGLHIHRNPPGSISSPSDLATDFESRLNILRPLAESLNNIDFLDLGGGIDSPWIYRPKPSELGEFHNPATSERIRARIGFPRFHLEEAGHKISSALSRTLGQDKNRWRLQLEPGRAVCTRALSTLLEVRAVKDGLYPDAQIVLTDGNTAFLGPLHRAAHPLESKTSGDRSTFVYGNLPHSADWLFQNVPLPKLKPGDRILISYTGAYFLPLESRFGHALPAIYDVEANLFLRSPE